MITIGYNTNEFDSTAKPQKIVKTMAISLSCLLGYGIHEDRRTVQKMMAHREFRAYEENRISRNQFIFNIAPKFKLDEVETNELLLSVIRRCSLDKKLLSSAVHYSETILGLIDIPFEELDCLKQMRPDLKEAIKGLPLITMSKIAKSWVVISRDPEVASVHRSMGINSIPYSPAQLKNIEGHLRTLNPSACYQSGLAALSNTLETYQLKSIIEMDLPQTSESEKVTDAGILLEYFNPLLIAIYYPEILLSEIEAQVVAFVRSGPFGYFGTEFNRLPADIDTMSLNVAVLYEMKSISRDEGVRAMNWVLSNTNNDVLQVYFDVDRPRVDHVVLCNMLYACYILGLESNQIVKTNEKLVQDYFLNDGYMFGTKYYHTPETFLFHFGRVLKKFGQLIPNYQILLSKFKSSLAGRIGLPATPLDISKRIIMCNNFSILNFSDAPLLLSQQKSDGSWNPADLYLLPTTKGRVYNPAVDMCFCLKALEVSFQLNP